MSCARPPDFDPVRDWTPIASFYDPLMAGSIDGTDTEPHDRAVVRALDARFVRDPSVTGEPRRTIFVGRLHADTSESGLEAAFERHGEVRRVRIVRDLVTGQSRRFGFVEFAHREEAARAVRRSQGLVLEGNEVVVEPEFGRSLPGWVPRRLGGGFGGRRESGQLRFGGITRQFRRPLGHQGGGFSKRK